jgi:hypothetical protein
MKTFIWKLLPTAVVMIGLVSCALGHTSTRPMENPRIRPFLEKSVEEQVESANHLAIGDRIDLYLYGVQRYHPPRMQLSRPISKLGATAIPHLQQLLMEDSTDATLRDVLHVLAEMCSLKTYQLSSSPELLTLLERRVAAPRSETGGQLLREMMHEARACP